MNDHEKIEEMLIDLALGELPENQKPIVDEHLKHCDQCRQLYSKLQALNSATEQIKNSQISDELCASAKDRLLNKVKQAPAAGQQFIWSNIMKNTVIKFAAAAVLILAVSIGIVMWNNTEQSSNYAGSNDPVNDGGITTNTNIQSILAEQLKDVDELFAASDSAGLIKLLKNDKYQHEAKIKAANYLAKMGDADAIDPLLSLASQQESKDNPFQQAADAIRASIKTTATGAATTALVNNTVTETAKTEKTVTNAPPVVASSNILELLPAEIIFCLRINQFDASIYQLDRYLADLVPIPMAATMGAKGQLSNLLADPTLVNIDTAGNFAIFGLLVGDEPGPEDLCIAALIPMKDYSKFVSENTNCSKADANGINTLKAMGRKTLIAGLGKYALLNLEGDYEDVVAVRNILAAKKDGLGSTLKPNQLDSATSKPVWAFASVTNSMDVYGPFIKERIEQSKEFMKKQNNSANELPAEALNFYVALLDIIIGEVDNVSLSLEATDDVVNVNFNTLAVPGTPLARMYSAAETEPVPNKLLHYLPEEALFNLALKLDSPFWEELNLTGLDLFTMMSKDPVEKEALEKMQIIIAEMVDSMGENYVTSFSVNANTTPPFTGILVSEVKDAEKFKQTNEQILMFWNEGSISEIYQETFAIGIDFSVDRAVEDYRGVVIDAALLGFETDDPNSEMEKIVGAIYGNGFEYRWATTNGLYLCAIGGDSEVKIKSLIDTVLDGTAGQIQPEISNALALLEESDKCTFIGTYNFVKHMQMSVSFLANMANMASVENLEIFEMDFSSESAASFGATLGSSQMDLQVAVPKEHVIEAKRAVENIGKVMQQMNQAAMEAQKRKVDEAREKAIRSEANHEPEPEVAPVEEEPAEMMY